MSNTGHRRNKIQATISHSAVVALVAVVLMSACTGTGSSNLLEPPAMTGTTSIPVTTPKSTVTPSVTAHPVTPSPALATVTPARGLPLTPAPSPEGLLFGESLPLPQDDATTWYLPGSPHIAAMRDTIVSVFRTNELDFDLGYPVQGFSPDPIYPRLFIRDTSTLMTGASYFYPAERLRWSVEAFLRQQYDETNYPAPTFPLRLLLPPGFAPGEVWLDGTPLTWDTFTLGQDTYLNTTLPPGRHSLVVEAAMD